MESVAVARYPWIADKKARPQTMSVTGIDAASGRFGEQTRKNSPMSVGSKIHVDRCM